MEELTEQLLERHFHQQNTFDECTPGKHGVYESIEQCLMTI